MTNPNAEETSVSPARVPAEPSLETPPTPPTPSTTIPLGNSASDALNPSATTSSGEIVKIAETEVYISKPSDVETGSSSLLILLTNGAGVHAINNQIQADHFAKEGYFVVMPDLFNGDPAPNGAVITEQEENQGLLDQIKLKAVEGVKGFMIDMWFARHNPENTDKVESILNAIHEQYGDKLYTKALGTYAVGYSIGGKYALMLAGKENVVVAAACAHGAMVSHADMMSIKKPVTLACLQNDAFFPDEIREDGRKYLEESKIEHEIRIYEDVPHGFGVYGNYPDAHIRASQKESFGQFITFFRRH